MKVVRCDVCKTIVSGSETATIEIRPGNFSGRFSIPNNGSDTIITHEYFDLCKDCLVKSLRKYYGEQLGKGEKKE